MTKKWLIHFIAQCQGCDWSSEDFLHGQEAATQHAERSGHLVKADAGYAIEYVKPKRKKAAQREGKK